MNNLFDKIWLEIVKNEGEIFRTKRGLEFTYEINKNCVKTNRTDYSIPKSDFEKAFVMLPLDGPCKINNEVRGPSYIWSILNDNRIIG